MTSKALKDPGFHLPSSSSLRDSFFRSLLEFNGLVIRLFQGLAGEAGCVDSHDTRPKTHVLSILS